MRSDILSLTPAERVRIILEEREPGYIYRILSSSYKEPEEELRGKYKIRLDIPRKRVFIAGEYEDLGKLFYHLISRGLEFESVGQQELRADLVMFVNKIR